MGERDLSLPGGLRPGDQEVFTDTGDTGLGDTGGLDLASGLPTMESMEKPSLAAEGEDLLCAACCAAWAAATAAMALVVEAAVAIMVSAARVISLAVDMKEGG